MACFCSFHPWSVVNKVLCLIGIKFTLIVTGRAKIDFYALFDPEKVTDGNKNHFCGCLCIVDS